MAQNTNRRAASRVRHPPATIRTRHPTHGIPTHGIPDPIGDPALHSNEPLIKGMSGHKTPEFRYFSYLL